MPIDLLTALRRSGPRSGGELARELGISRPTLMRAVQAAGPAIVVRGRARATRYAARRDLRGRMDPLPIFRVDPQGTLHRIAQLDLCHPHGCAIDTPLALGWPLDARMQTGWFEGLPYPLQDLRPQGFLGRHFARAHAAVLQVPEDPTRWSDEDTLHAISLLGSDAPGDLIVGETAARLWLEGRADVEVRAVDDEALGIEWPRLADQAMALGVAGSSAGGEHPKFTALRAASSRRSARHVIVKFSGSDRAPGTRRWSDLLVCEHLALTVLREAGDLRAAASRLEQFGGRTFLEVDRFDRHGLHGRSGVVSWMAADADLVGSGGRPWPEATQGLSQRGWLSPDDARRIQRLWLFGRLIANSDMHDGNLALEALATPGGPAFRPAPAYDMLPMLYAPTRGMELPVRDWHPPLPLPHERSDWEAVAAPALRFWESAAADDRIGSGFRRVCASNAKRLRSTMG